MWGGSQNLGRRKFCQWSTAPAPTDLESSRSPRSQASFLCAFGITLEMPSQWDIDLVCEAVEVRPRPDYLSCFCFLLIAPHSLSHCRRVFVSALTPWGAVKRAWTRSWPFLKKLMGWGYAQPGDRQEYIAIKGDIEVTTNPLWTRWYSYFYWYAAALELMSRVNNYSF